MKLFLFDIEGTTTEISFVHKILFPYARARMQEFVLEHKSSPSVARAIEEAKATVLEEENQTLDLDQAIQKLMNWIDTDRKHGALKELQGQIWDKGYAEGHFKGHVYADVKTAFEKIKTDGHEIGIYSSGSVHAQKLIFGFSEAGDLTPYISYYFDTKVGGKRETASYEKISELTKYKASDIHFFSDIPEELEAAREAGFEVSHVVRPGTNPSSYPMIQDFRSL